MKRALAAAVGAVILLSSPAGATTKMCAVPASVERKMDRLAGYEQWARSQTGAYHVYDYVQDPGTVKWAVQEAARCGGRVVITPIEGGDETIEVECPDYARPGTAPIPA